jgi:hypothetical protein
MTGTGETLRSLFQLAQQYLACLGDTLYENMGMALSVWFEDEI